jgi:hypothetical protein
VQELKTAAVGSSVTHPAQPSPPRISHLLLGLLPTQNNKEARDLFLKKTKQNKTKNPQHLCNSLST